MRVSIVLLSLLAVFTGAVWASLGGLSLSAHSLGMLWVIVGLVAFVIEVYVQDRAWWRKQ
jgi:1,4-dihydroxy-2-naphthoate octaprenyltransferase